MVVLDGAASTSHSAAGGSFYCWLAIGNAIDRLRFGKVVDFIDLHYSGLHWPAFNLADAAITIGAVLWGCSILREQETSRR